MSGLHGSGKSTGSGRISNGIDTIQDASIDHQAEIVYEGEGNDFVIGRGNKAQSPEVLRGMMDEVRVYNGGLTEAEVKQNFASEGFATEEEEIVVVETAQKLAITWGRVKMGM